MAKRLRSIRQASAIALLRLYPRAWRRRYGAEQVALLEETQPGWFKVADVARGALRETFDPATHVEIDRTLWGKLGRLVMKICLSCVLACLTTVVVSLTLLFGGNAVSQIFFHDGLLLDSAQVAFFLFSDRGLLLSLILSPGVFFCYSLVFTAPVAVGLAAIRMVFGQPSPLVARLVWLLSFLWFDSWFAGFSFAHLTSLGIGGWVLACLLFPRRVARPPSAVTVAAP
jgi:hypothetical protein